MWDAGCKLATQLLDGPMRGRAKEMGLGSAPPAFRLRVPREGRQCAAKDAQGVNPIESSAEARRRHSHHVAIELRRIIGQPVVKAVDRDALRLAA